MTGMGEGVVGKGGNSRWKHKAQTRNSSIYKDSLMWTSNLSTNFLVLSVRRPGFRSECDYLVAYSCL